MVVAVPLRKTHPVRRLAARDHDLPDPELARRFDDIIRAEDVAAKALGVRDQHVARVCGEVDDGIGSLDA